MEQPYEGVELRNGQRFYEPFYDGKPISEAREVPLHGVQGWMLRRGLEKPDTVGGSLLQRDDYDQLTQLHLIDESEPDKPVRPDGTPLTRNEMLQIFSHADQIFEWLPTIQADRDEATQDHLAGNPPVAMAAPAKTKPPKTQASAVKTNPTMAAAASPTAKAAATPAPAPAPAKKATAKAVIPKIPPSFWDPSTPTIVMPEKATKTTKKAAVAPTPAPAPVPVPAPMPKQKTKKLHEPFYNGQPVSKLARMPYSKLRPILDGPANHTELPIEWDEYNALRDSGLIVDDGAGPVIKNPDGSTKQPLTKHQLLLIHAHAEQIVAGLDERRADMIAAGLIKPTRTHGNWLGNTYVGVSTWIDKHPKLVTYGGGLVLAAVLGGGILELVHHLGNHSHLADAVKEHQPKGGAPQPAEHMTPTPHPTSHPSHHQVAGTGSEHHHQMTSHHGQTGTHQHHTGNGSNAQHHQPTHHHQQHSQPAEGSVVHVHKGDGYTNLIGRYAHQHGYHTSGAENYRVYLQLQEHFHTHILHQIHAYHMGSHNLGISRPGTDHWNKGAEQTMDKLFKAASKKKR